MRMICYDGPDCPECGCRDTEEIASGGSHWFRMPGAKKQPDSSGAPSYRCNHCGRTFMPSLDTIEYVVNKCPRCGKKKPPVTGTRRFKSQTVRYHKCTCGKTFRSIERK